MLQSKETLAANPWRLLPLLVAMNAMGPATLNIMVPALPAITAKLGTDTATAQLTISLYLFSLACAQLVLGPLSDRFGRRPVAIAGLTLAVMASLGAIAAPSIGALILARILQAAGASVGIVIGRAIIRDLYDRERAAGMLGLVTTAMVIAPMLTPMIGGFIDTAFGWEAIFIFVTILSSTVLLCAALILPETHDVAATSQPSAMWHEWRALFVDKKFYAYISAAAFSSVPHFTVLGAGPHVVITMMGRTSAEYGLWCAVVSVGYMSGNFTMSRIGKYLRLDTLIMIGLGIELVGGGLMATLFETIPSGGPIIMYFPQFFISYGNGLMLPNCISGAISVRPQAAGAAAGIVGFSQMAAGATSAQIISMLLAGGSSPMPVAWTILIVVTTSIVLFRVLSPRTSAAD